MRYFGFLFTVPVISSALLLSSCSGGGSSGGSSGTDPGENNDGGELETTTQVVHRVSLTGRAVDPYITGAGICADLNDNMLCDEGEPRGVTDADGSFNLGEWPEGREQVRLLLLNRGSWEVPQYGLHEGKPYGMSMSIIANRDTTYTIEVGGEFPPPPPIHLTPATTLEADYGLSSASIVNMLNSFSEELGKTFTAEDLSADPVSEYGDSDINDLNEEDMAVFRAYLTLYGVNRILSSTRSLGEDIAGQFATEILRESSSANAILAQLVEAISTATQLDALQAAATQIDAGQLEMKNQIRASAGQYADMVINDVGDFPVLTADIVISAGVAVIEFELSRAQQWIKEGLNAENPTYESVARTVAERLAADFENGAAGQKAMAHSPVLGVKAYALRNKAFFTDIQSLTYPGFGNVGEGIYDGIESSSEELAAGFTCTSSGFFIFLNDEDNADSLCTSALPTSITDDIAGYYGVEGELTQENSPVDLNVWQHFPVGNVQVSDGPAVTSCSVSGTVYADNAPAAGVPMYFALGGSDQEINLITDENGHFSFTRIPGIKYAADGWAAEEVTGEDHYFIGVIAGKRRPVPDYLEYEANADYFINCRTITEDGNEKAVTGTPGNMDEEQNFIYESADVAFYPELRPVVAGTELNGFFPTNMLSGGIRAEIHSQQRFYAGQASSPSVEDGGWIMDAIEVEEHPFTSLNTDTGAFTVTELAGGDYRIRPYFADPDDTTRWVECDSEAVTVLAGTTVNVTVTLADGDLDNCYYTDDDSDYGKDLVLSTD